MHGCHLLAQSDDCWGGYPLSASLHFPCFPAHPFVTAYWLRGRRPFNSTTEFVRAEIAMHSRPGYTYNTPQNLLYLYRSSYPYLTLYYLYPCMLPVHTGSPAAAGPRAHCSSCTEFWSANGLPHRTREEARRGRLDRTMREASAPALQRAGGYRRRRRASRQAACSCRPLPHNAGGFIREAEVRWPLAGPAGAMPVY